MSKLQNSNNFKKATKGRLDNRLNLRQRASTATGFPDVFYGKYSITMRISGRTEIQYIIREVNDDGSLGKRVPFEEGLKLCKAPGFVRSLVKSDAKAEALAKTLAFFFNTDKKKPIVMKDPKGVIATTESKVKALEKTVEAIKEALPTGPDKPAVQFCTELANRATVVTERILAKKVSNEAFDEKQELAEAGFPQTMKSKFLTGSLETTPQGRIHSSLLGKDPAVFSQLSIREILAMPNGLLNLFYSPQELHHLRSRIGTARLALLLGHKDWNDVPSKLKDKVLSFQMPVMPILTKLQIFERYISPGGFCRLRNLENSLFPDLDKVANGMLKRWYAPPPTDISKVKAHWTKLAGTELNEPDVVSQSYLIQTVKAMQDKVAELPEYPLLQEGIDFPDGGVIPSFPKKWKRYEDQPMRPVCHRGYRFLDLLSVTAEVIGVDGKTVKTHEGIEFQEFQPLSLVGRKKTEKKRDRDRRQGSRKNELTPYSQKRMKWLRSRINDSEVVGDVIAYLEDFLEIKMQEMAAHIVYMTCGSKADDAQVHYLGSKIEGPEGTDEDDDDGETDDEDDEEEPAPPIDADPPGGKPKENP